MEGISSLKFERTSNYADSRSCIVIYFWKVKDYTAANGIISPSDLSFPIIALFVILRAICPLLNFIPILRSVRTRYYSKRTVPYK